MCQLPVFVPPNQSCHIFKVFMPLSEGHPSGTPIPGQTGNLQDLDHDRHGEHRKKGSSYMEVGSQGVLVEGALRLAHFG